MMPDRLYCSPITMTFTRMPPSSPGRPPRDLACRVCGETITTREEYWYCCRECPAVCGPCWSAGPGRDPVTV